MKKQQKKGIRERSSRKQKKVLNQNEKEELQKIKSEFVDLKKQQETGIGVFQNSLFVFQEAVKKRTV